MISVLSVVTISGLSSGFTSIFASAFTSPSASVSFLGINFSSAFGAFSAFPALVSLAALSFLSKTTSPISSFKDCKSSCSSEVDIFMSGVGLAAGASSLFFKDSKTFTSSKSAETASCAFA